VVATDDEREVLRREGLIGDLTASIVSPSVPRVDDDVSVVLVVLVATADDYGVSAVPRTSRDPGL
jgi:hypothetical protein